MPLRRAAAARPSDPPALPSEADSITPLTLQVTVRRTGDGRTSAIELTISRTADRVHVRAGDREWLFERNLRDRRRVSGFLIAHEERTIVEYEETDLRIALGVRGWADVLMLGFDPSVLKDSVRSGRFRIVDRVRFDEFSSRTGPVAVWWSERELLSHRFELPAGKSSTLVVIAAIRHHVDATVFELPAQRFPSYRVIRLAEWQEHR